MIQMSARGPDGYPLDVHGHKLPLPPQDAVWQQGADATDVLKQRAMHPGACADAERRRCHSVTDISPELRAGAPFKPRAEDFI